MVCRELFTPLEAMNYMVSERCPIHPAKDMLQPFEVALLASTTRSTSAVIVISAVTGSTTAVIVISAVTGGTISSALTAVCKHA